MGTGAFTLSLCGCSGTVRIKCSPKSPNPLPNVILCMTDDQGWGDTGYNGHPVLQTPTLDAISNSGIRFDRWYAAAPVCSPTRGSCLTGRHPYRYGVFSANKGHLPHEEVTLAEALKQAGYRTGHFGKWHLGTLTKTGKDSNRGGPNGHQHYAPPWEHGFDVCFSTEAKVPTWDPMVQPGTDKPYGTAYWNEAGEKVAENLQGDDSRIIMDRAIPFIRKAAESKKPFLAVIWFHTPHLPTVAGAKYRNIYKSQSEKTQHYYGCITAMDEQLGRLRKELRNLGIAPETMCWFCSDNGPEGKQNKAPGSAGPFRGRKRSLFEGGVRVPALLEWPAKITQPRIVTLPCSTLDYYPTIMEFLGLKIKNQPEPIDGVSLVDLIEHHVDRRPKPICFESAKQLALTGNRYKLISTDNGKNYMLFDLIDDPGEQIDLSAQKPEIAKQMKRKLTAWRTSCKASLNGQDYKSAKANL